jgi:hypothetical protein
MIPSYDEHMNDFLETNHDEALQVINEFYRQRLLSDDDFKVITQTTSTNKAVKIATHRIFQRLLQTSAALKAANRPEVKTELLNDQITLSAAIQFLSTVIERDSNTVINKLFIQHYLK